MRTSTFSIRLFAALAMLLCLAGSAIADPPSKDWSFDSIKLKNGYVLQGLILDETVAAVRFQHVRRSVGRPTVCMTATLRRTDIDKIDKLSDADREVLRNRLKELDPNGEGERKRMEALELKTVDWDGKPKSGRRYDSDYFSLVSNAPEDVVRRSAVRLEQIYTAYVHFLPPRFPGGKATTILLYPSLEEYQKALAAGGWKLQNPAFFDPASNRIVCGNNLLKMGSELERTRQQHQELRGELDKREALLRQLYGKKPMELARHLQQQVFDNRKRIAEVERYNDGIFDNETKRLFAILYHEAFHAYAGNFVYPPCAKPRPDGAPGELPRWLNEGLAQIFETAIVEAGELRVGHADRDRLVRAKDALRDGQLLSVKELLQAGPGQFLVKHGEERNASDRAYVTSWALASYLMFERRLLGTGSLDDFVRSINQNGNAEEAFCRLMGGQKVPELEKEFQAWLQKLKADGSLMDSTPGK